MALLSQECGFSESLFIVCHIFLDLGDFLFDRGSSGCQEVRDEIVHAANISISILDVLGIFQHERIVLIGSNLEIELELLERFVEVNDQLLDSVN